MVMKGKLSGIVICLCEIVNYVKWVLVWLSFFVVGFGCNEIFCIYWKN